jgi:phosphoribosylanthranilate isomerase
LSRPVILAGGLNPSNVRMAIELVKPFAVDVSGGVERCKGKKDPLLVKAFLSEVRSEYKT